MNQWHHMEPIISQNFSDSVQLLVVILNYIMLWYCIMFAGVVNLWSGISTFGGGQSSAAIWRCVSVTAYLLWPLTFIATSPTDLMCVFVCVWLDQQRSITAFTCRFLTPLNPFLWLVRACSVSMTWTEIQELCTLKSKVQVLHKPSMLYHNLNTGCLCFCDLCCDESSRRLQMSWVLNYQLTHATQMETVYLGKQREDLTRDVDALYFLCAEQSLKNLGAVWDQHVEKSNHGWTAKDKCASDF